MKSPTSNYSFSRVPRVAVPRSAFKRDRTLKTTFDSGFLVPFFYDEVYPGDTFNVSTTMFGRLTTPITPFMDNLYLDAFYFYVPYRLLWKNWNKMLGEQDKPDDSTDYLTPVLTTQENGTTVDQVVSGSLLDYFGFPVGTFSGTGKHGLEINAFLPRAYNKIWNDHFRDENLQDSVYFDDGDGPDLVSNYTLLRRGKRKDYFTSCLPWPQKGPGAEISIGGRASVFGDYNPLALINMDDTDGAYNAVGALGFQGTAAKRGSTVFGRYDDDSQTVLQFPENIGGSNAFRVAGKDDLAEPSLNPSGFESSGLYADLSSATPISINDMRMAFQLQRWMEKSARSGTRAPEIILGHFGVVCPDFRLQRSEYLGGGEVPIHVHQVVQNGTLTEASDSPLGTTGAYGVLAGTVGFSKSFVEHGVVIGLVACRADLTYSQGLDRSWSRRSKFDYYWPELAHLGEQAVLNKEIYADGSANDNRAFGYQERWAELRYGISKLTGGMRTNNGDLGVIWTLSQHFNALPRLNDSFIKDMPPLSRVLAISDTPEILFDSLTKCNCVRPLPTYSVPGLIDHF